MIWNSSGARPGRSFYERGGADQFAQLGMRYERMSVRAPLLPGGLPYCDAHAVRAPKSAQGGMSGPSRALWYQPVPSSQAFSQSARLGASTYHARSGSPAFGSKSRTGAPGVRQSTQAYIEQPQCDIGRYLRVVISSGRGVICLRSAVWGVNDAEPRLCDRSQQHRGRGPVARAIQV